MNSKIVKYSINNKEYDVHITKKNMRSITYRLKKDGIYISAPYFVSEKRILKGLETFGPKLVQKFSHTFANYSFEEDFVFLLGKKVSLKELGIKNEDELNKYLKRQALEVITNLVRKYEEIMEIKEPYKVSVRNTSTRFGSNSSLTHRLSFQVGLVHFSEDIISTVVVHELAHDKHRNHQKDFYDCVYLYCPNYDELQKKLKRGIRE